MRGGSVVMDWDQIVKTLTVSSNEGQACRLIDGIHSTYWQSSGPQGKVCTVAFVEEIHLDVDILHNICVYGWFPSVNCVPYLLDQTSRLLFISSRNFVRLLFESGC